MAAAPPPPAPAVGNTFTPFASKLKGFDSHLEVVDIPLQNQFQGQPAAGSAQSRKLLKSNSPQKPFLPGQPRILVQDDQVSIDKLKKYLQKVHLTREIDKLLPYMRFIFVQTPSFRHITPLHHQEARERKVIVDEHPGLHLVWYYERIFIKPIPAYFYSTAFWEYIEHADPDVFQAGLGFMRSYYFLIQYETDYAQACKIGLIPKKRSDGQHPTYEEYCAFIAPFSKHVTDDLCSRRFHYGEIRLTRINRTAFFFRLKLAYFHIYPQWGSYLSHFLAPIITIFAIATVVLNSMQVSLAAIDMGPESAQKSHGWPHFVRLSKWFPVTVIILIAAVSGLGLFGVIFMGIKDLEWANKTRRQKKAGDRNAGEKSHGMIW